MHPKIKLETKMAERKIKNPTCDFEERPRTNHANKPFKNEIEARRITESLCWSKNSL